jgi:hypothetical protein
MKLSFVKLVSSSYDPRTDKRHALGGVTDFDAANGYEMELRDGYVTIAHSGRKALYSLGRVDFSLVAEDPTAEKWLLLPRGMQSGAAREATIAAYEAHGYITPEQAKELREEPPPAAASAVALSDPEDAVHFELRVESIPDECASADAPPPATATITGVDKARGVVTYEADKPRKKRRR